MVPILSCSPSRPTYAARPTECGGDKTIRLSRNRTLPKNTALVEGPQRSSRAPMLVAGPYPRRDWPLSHDRLCTTYMVSLRRRRVTISPPPACQTQQDLCPHEREVKLEYTIAEESDGHTRIGQYTIDALSENQIDHIVGHLDGCFGNDDHVGIAYP